VKKITSERVYLTISPNILFCNIAEYKANFFAGVGAKHAY